MGIFKQDTKWQSKVIIIISTVNLLFGVILIGIGASLMLNETVDSTWSDIEWNTFNFGKVSLILGFLVIGLSGLGYAMVRVKTTHLACPYIVFSLLIGSGLFCGGIILCLPKQEFNAA